MKTLQTLACAAALVTVASQAQAVSPFTFTGSGTILASNNAAFSVGEAASLRFTFDADTPDSRPVASSARYDDPFVGKIVGRFGDETFRVDGPGQQIFVEDSMDDVFFSRTDPVAVSDSGLFSGIRLSFLFRDLDQTAFSSEALPTSLTLADFQGSTDAAEFSLTGDGFGTVTATFSSASIAPAAAVPLPASVPMLLAGLGMLAMVRRRPARRGA